MCDREETSFGKALEDLINKYSMENGSDTPDFILANYLEKSLEVFDETMKLRETWYGRGEKIVLQNPVTGESFPVPAPIDRDVDAPNYEKDNE